MKHRAPGQEPYSAAFVPENPGGGVCDRLQATGAEPLPRRDRFALQKRRDHIYAMGERRAFESFRVIPGSAFCHLQGRA